jgi:membrane AbrB-like protein
MTWPDAATLRKLATALALGGLGGGFFAWLGLPAGWLTGAAICVGIAALAGVPLAMPLPVRNTAFAVLGASIGATVTPATIAMLWRWPMGVIGLVVSIFVTLNAIAYYLEKVHGYDRTSARLAGIPGNMQLVLALTDQCKCDKPRVLIIQVFRLVMMVIVAPMLLALGGHGPPPNPRLSMAPTTTPMELLTLIGFAAAGILLMRRISFPAPFMFGAMFGGAVLYGSGMQSDVMPAWILTPCFVVTGTIVGTNLIGMDRKLLVDTLLAGLGSIVIGTAVSLACAWPVAWMIGVPTAQVWFAYAPGGVDMMAIMALALGLDAAFVGAHHAARFFCLGVMVPVWMRDLLRRPADKPVDGA